MGKRQYTDADKATALAALDANEGNVAKTARDLKIPRATLIEWRDGRVSDEVSDIRHQKKADLADRLEAIAHSLIDAIPDKLLEADLRAVGTTLGITVDKMRLLREQPTTIEQMNQLTEEQRAQRIAELLRRADDRRAAAVADGAGAGRTGAAGASPLH